MSRPRILLADDHKIVMEGVKSLLDSEFDLVGTVGNGRELIAAANKLRPDIIVVDISMPLLNGIEAAKQLKKADPWVKIIFLTMHPDVVYATRALEEGASGYVLKHSASSELVMAIHEALKDRTYVTSLIAKEVMKSLMDGSYRRQKSDLHLTTRQQEVLQLVAEGRSAKEIASVLNLSPRTIEFHKQRIMKDLGLHTQTELVHYALKHGIVSA